MSASSRLPRFFAGHPLAPGPLRLDGDQAHHLMHVLRIDAGQAVCLFDGQGHECLATVTKKERHSVQLQAETPAAVSRELERSISLAVSLPKGDRQKILVEKLTELGVSQLIPLETRRGVAQPSESAAERLKKIVIAASQQCGRNTLMRIGQSRTVGGMTGKPAGDFSHGQRLFAHPGAPEGGLPDSSAREVIVAIGPEGGFSDDETELFSAAGWKAIHLGPTILRIETAAIAVAARLAANASCWREPRPESTIQ